MTQTTADRYRTMLAKARAKFMHYADNHREKVGTKYRAGTAEADDALRKARANDEIADEIAAMLDLELADQKHAAQMADLEPDAGVTEGLI